MLLWDRAWGFLEVVCAFHPPALKLVALPTQPQDQAQYLPAMAFDCEPSKRPSANDFDAADEENKKGAPPRPAPRHTAP